MVQLQILVDCSGDDNDEKNPETAFSNKKTTLVKVIKESPVRKTNVFCNKIVPLPCICVYHQYQYHRHVGSNVCDEKCKAFKIQNKCKASIHVQIQ